MENQYLKHKNIIKVLLKTVIDQEKKADEKNSTEILSFTDFSNALGLTEERKCEKLFEDLGNMIEENIDLDTAIEQFIVEYNI